VPVICALVTSARVGECRVDAVFRERRDGQARGVHSGILTRFIASHFVNLLRVTRQSRHHGLSRSIAALELVGVPLDEVQTVNKAVSRKVTGTPRCNRRELVRVPLDEIQAINKAVQRGISQQADENSYPVPGTGRMEYRRTPPTRFQLRRHRPGKHWLSVPSSQSPRIPACGKLWNWWNE
jgi:hypothetical protein